MVAPTMQEVPRNTNTSVERGQTGTTVFGGIVYEEDYNLDWRAPERYHIADRMVSSDGTVAAGMRAIKLPLMGLDWTVESASDSPVHVEQAAFCQQQIQYMSFSWQYYLTHVLRMLDYGNHPFEKAWERTLLPNGEVGIGIHKIAPRHPKTIIEWHVDEHGSPIKLVQQLNDDRGQGIMQIDLPIRDLLIFTHNQEGADFRGKSLLRPAYKHWQIKEGMEKVDAVAKEKRGMGIDVVAMTADATDDDRATFETALQSIRSHQRNYITYRTDKGEYRIEGIGESGVLDTLATIELHDIRILRALGTEFIGVGTASKFGSYAMHVDKTSYTLMSLISIGDNINETHNRHLFKQLVDYNWGPQPKDMYPRMRHTKLDTRDVESLARALGMLTSGGLLTPTPELEAELRELLEVAPLQPGQTSQAGVPPVREKQVDTMMALGKRIFETRDLDALINLSVPFKNEAASYYQTGASPLERVAARSKANHEADMLKETFTQIMCDYLETQTFDEFALRQILMEAH